MEKTDMGLNRRLAALLGWTNFTETGGALIGTPSAGVPECRGQAKVPDWEGDWRDCGPLIGEYVRFDEADPLHMATERGRGILAKLGANVSPDAATRYVIVTFVIAKLECTR